MKCIELKVVNCKGSSLCLLELGGVYVPNECKIIVKAEIASGIMKQYQSMIEKVGDVEKDKLAQGNYELVAAKPAPKKPEPPKPETVKDVADNRSMEGSSEVKIK